MAVAARVVGAADQPAISALLDMAAECGGAARLDGRHDATFDAAEMLVVRLPERVAVAAEDVRHLQRGAHAPSQDGGVTSSRKRSSGLGVPRIVLVATWV